MDTVGSGAGNSNLTHQRKSFFSVRGPKDKPQKPQESEPKLQSESPAGSDRTDAGSDRTDAGSDRATSSSATRKHHELKRLVGHFSRSRKSYFHIIHTGKEQNIMLETQKEVHRNLHIILLFLNRIQEPDTDYFDFQFIDKFNEVVLCFNPVIQQLKYADKERSRVDYLDSVDRQQNVTFDSTVKIPQGNNLKDLLARVTTLSDFMTRLNSNNSNESFCVKKKGESQPDPDFMTIRKQDCKHYMHTQLLEANQLFKNNVIHLVQDFVSICETVIKSHQEEITSKIGFIEKNTPNQSSLKKLKQQKELFNVFHDAVVNFKQQYSEILYGIADFPKYPIGRKNNGSSEMIDNAQRVQSPQSPHPSQFSNPQEFESPKRSPKRSDSIPTVPTGANRGSPSTNPGIHNS